MSSMVTDTTDLLRNKREAGLRATKCNDSPAESILQTVAAASINQTVAAASFNQTVAAASFRLGKLDHVIIVRNSVTFAPILTLKR